MIFGLVQVWLLERNGVPDLNPGFLKKCGYNMISLENVVTCYNTIITAHCCIHETWHNPTTNTYGLQIDRILLKSFQLFPKLDSSTTKDVINYYNHFQELAMGHLMAVMPYDTIVLKNGYEGLCIPGLGMHCYANSSQAMLDFLPRLIPRTLSSQINAMLGAVQCKSNNCYDYTFGEYSPSQSLVLTRWSQSKLHCRPTVKISLTSLRLICSISDYKQKCTTTLWTVPAVESSSVLSSTPTTWIQ